MKIDKSKWTLDAIYARIEAAQDGDVESQKDLFWMFSSGVIVAPDAEVAGFWKGLLDGAAREDSCREFRKPTLPLSLMPIEEDYAREVLFPSLSILREMAAQTLALVKSQVDAIKTWLARDEELEELLNSVKGNPHRMNPQQVNLAQMQGWNPLQAANQMRLGQMTTAQEMEAQMAALKKQVQGSMPPPMPPMPSMPQVMPAMPIYPEPECPDDK